MSAAKNILFISYDGMTDPLGQSQVIPYLLGLSNHGYDITILSCEKKNAFQQNKLIVEHLLSVSSIKWVPLFYTKKPPVLSTLLDILKLKSAVKKIQLQRPVQMVHTRPGIPALVGLWMKRKYGVKFLNDIREFYADSRVEGGMWDIKNPLFRLIYKYFKSKESQQVIQSDGIVCLTSAAEKIIVQWPEYKRNIPLSMIPCSVDLNLFNGEKLDKQEQKLLAKKLGIKNGELVISYLGSIGGWYLTDEMMRFCKLLSHKIKDVKFLFISPHQHELIQRIAAANNISSGSIITVRAQRTEVPMLLSLSTYSLFFIKPCYSKLSSSPTKHGEIMGMGIPVITNSGVGDVDEIVKKYNGGLVINDFSDASFHKIIDQLADAEIFSMYDLYVMSSIHEGFGLAAIEAMACGLPALLSNLPVLREVTFDNAIFFDLEDPEAFADQIKKILNQEYNLDNFSNKGVEIAKKYNKQNYLERLLAIYDEVLQVRN